MVEIKTNILNFLVSFVKCYCVKTVQIRSFFWSRFSRIWTEYGYGEMRSISPYSVRMRKIRTRKNSVFRHFSRSVFINNKILQKKFQVNLALKTKEIKTIGSRPGILHGLCKVCLYLFTI